MGNKFRRTKGATPKFNSLLIPSYLKRTKNIEELLPVVYNAVHLIAQTIQNVIEQETGDWIHFLNAGDSFCNTIQSFQTL